LRKRRKIPGVYLPSATDYKLVIAEFENACHLCPEKHGTEMSLQNRPGSPAVVEAARFLGGQLSVLCRTNPNHYPTNFYRLTKFRAAISVDAASPSNQITEVPDARFNARAECSAN